MSSENDRYTSSRRDTAEFTSLSALHIDIPKSPVIRCRGCQPGSCTGKSLLSNTYLGVGSGLTSTGASPLNTEDLGKQIAATEVGNKISSKALLTVKSLRSVQSIPVLEAGNNEKSPDMSTEEVSNLHTGGVLLPASEEEGRQENDKNSDKRIHYHEKENSPALFKRSPSSSTDTPFTPNGILPDESNEANNALLEDMLREVSQVRGMRLRWIIYAIIFIVMNIFFLLFGEIHLLVKYNLVISEEELVRVSSATAVSQLEWLYFGTKNALRLFETTPVIHHDTSFSARRGDTLDLLCRSVGGAPLIFAAYGDAGATLIRSSTCPSSSSTSVHLPPSLHIKNELPIDSPHIAIYNNTFIIAMMTSMNESEILVVILQKGPIGRLLFTNSIPTYSASALKHSTMSFLLPEFSSSSSSSELAVALHSLNEEYTSYNVLQPTPLGQLLHDTFNNTCDQGKAYTWHTVTRPRVDASYVCEHGAEDSQNEMPRPYLQYKGIMGGVSHVIICGVVCSHPKENKCTLDNPTSTWFIIDNAPLRRQPEETLTAVYIIIIIAFLLFFLMLAIAYLSISLPMEHLKSLVFSTIGGDSQTLTDKKKHHWIFYYTSCCWPGDLQALIRAFQLLSVCFRLNKKYVPLHVLSQHVLALEKKKDYVWGTIVEEIRLDTAADGEEIEEEEEGEEGEGEGEEGEGEGIGYMDIAGNDKIHISAFLKTMSAASSVSALRKQETLLPPEGNSSSVFASEGKMCEQKENPTMDSATSANNSSSHTNKNMDIYGRGMVLVESATILVVRLCAVELAYMTNYRAALKPHRRIMNWLLGRIRRYRGELFERSGDCIAATWNAFESCADHAQRAAACAFSISRLLSAYRDSGFRVGIVLHQGPCICGLVEDNKEAFTTVFGAVPRQAIALAELASSLPYFNILVSESVKQSLSSLYECIMVDVIKYHEQDNPIVMFELYEERRQSLLKGAPLSSAPPSLSPSTFAEEHARVFFDFRNHDFKRALVGIEEMRVRFPATGRRLLTRIEMLCKYYMRHEKELPMPYFRPFPTWPIFEAVANADCPHDLGITRSSKEDLFIETLRYSRPSKSMYEDDMVNFRQELHDNVLASKRTQNVSPTLRAAHLTSVKEAGTSTHISPRSRMLLAQMQASSSSESSPPYLRLSKGAGGEDSDEKEREDAVKEGEEKEFEKREDDDMCVVANSSSDESINARRRNKMKTKGTIDVGTDHGGECGGNSLLSIRTPTRIFATSNVSESVNKDKDDNSSFFGDAGGYRNSSSNNKNCDNVDNNGNNNNNNNNNRKEEEKDGDGRQRFSVTNRMGLAPVEGRGYSLFGVGDSFVSVSSETMVNAPSFSVCDLDGSFSRGAYEIPTEFVAKNGITYLLSSRVLGRGSFGCVYLGMDILSGRMVAIKFLPLPSEEEEVANVEREVVTMQKVKSNQVVEFVSYAFKNNLIIIVMECMMAGSLWGMISAFGSIPVTTARLFIRDVLRGLHKLHSSGVIHRDVKPQNVLLTLAGNCKISDFGASALLQELVRKRTEGKGLQIQGTPVYLAPESARGTPEEKSDIWSCGIMFIQLVTGELPYARKFLDMSPEVLVYQIGSGAAKPIIPDSLDKFDVEFICSCLREDPVERLSAQRLLELPLFAL